MMTRSLHGAAPERPRSVWSRELRWARGLDPLLRHPLTVLGAGMAVALLCGLVLHPRVLALAGGLAMIVTLGIAWPWISLRGLQGSLSFEQTRGREGQPITARLQFRNRVPWGAWGLKLRFGRDDANGTTPLALAHLGGWKRGEIDCSFVPDRRGEHPVGGAWLVTGFPFGLLEAERTLSVEQTVLVWPRTFPVGPIPEEAGGDVSEGTTFRDRPGDAGDLLGVRSYRRGDPLRRVHWGQTARHGELIVCERQAAAAPRVQVVLDLDPASHVGLGPNGSLEWAIRVAASLLDDWVGQGADAELVVGDRSISGRAGSTASRRRVLLDAIARLDARAGTPPLCDVLAGPTCRRFGRGLRVVVCTDRARLGNLGRRDVAGTRFAVLASIAFAPEASHGPEIDPGWPGHPWILIDDPTRVAEQLRNRRKEVVGVC